MKGIREYWHALSSLRKGFLVIGGIVVSPVIVMLCIVVGIAEVWKMIQGVEF